MSYRKRKKGKISKNLGTLASLTDKEKGILYEEFLEFLQGKKFLLPVKERGIPISIFNKKLSAFEAIVKYLREELGISYGEIGKILKRKAGPIGVTYRNSNRKFPGKLDCSSRQLVPFSIFKSNLTVFECLVLWLKDSRFSFKRIASLLFRNYRTIWTVYNHAKKKEKMSKSVEKNGRKRKK